MRTTPIILMTAVAMLVGIPAVAIAAPKDFASGAGKTTTGDKFNFTGHGTPDDARGQVHWDHPGTPLFEDVTGKVECVDVDGDEATLTGPLDEPRETPLGFFVNYFQLTVRDNSQPRGGAPDELAFALTRVDRSCAPFPFFLLTTEQGNIVVEDRTP